MDNKHEHIKPWAEKLNELQVPGVADAWQDMSVLLDAEMPVQPKRDRRRWALLILLLLLLIGVCHFPHGSQPDANAISPQDTVRPETGGAGSAMRRSDRPSDAKNSGLTNLAEQRDTLSGTRKIREGAKNRNSAAGKTIGDGKTTVSSDLDKTAGEKKAAEYAYGKKTDSHPEIAREPSLNSGAARDHIRASRSNVLSRKRKINSKKSARRQAELASASGTAQQDAPSVNDLSRQGMDTAAESSATAAAANDIKSVKSPTDSTKAAAKKTAPITKNPPKKDSVEDARGWAFALGLNQFFAVGDQQKSNFNSDGTSGTISDYIPVPVARYYFHQWFYLQAEAQFNSPQYSKTLLAGQGIKSAGFAGAPAVQSVFIKKLFYFNIPLSVHYSPVKNLFLGAGLQYSRLTNGVALFQDTRLSGGYIQNVVNLQDSTLIVSKLGSFKHDSAYQALRTNEWRFLLDLNYQWKRATIGVRYNQAFSDFIDVQVSYGHITEAQNRSLQVYLRYMLFDFRKKFLIGKK